MAAVTVAVAPVMVAAIAVAVLVALVVVRGSTMMLVVDRRLAHRALICGRTTCTLPHGRSYGCSGAGADDRAIRPAHLVTYRRAGSSPDGASDHFVASLVKVGAARQRSHGDQPCDHFPKHVALPELAC